MSGLSSETLGKALFALVWGEELLFTLMEKQLTRALDVEKEVVRTGRVLKEYGPVNEGDARRKASRIVHSLLR